MKNRAKKYGFQALRTFLSTPEEEKEEDIKPSGISIFIPMQRLL
jgi:hypothetical protein